MNFPFTNVVSPLTEMRSWETLWGLQGATQKSLSEMFARWSSTLPSEALGRIKRDDLFDCADVEEQVSVFIGRVAADMAFSICVNGTYHYPHRLRQAKYPAELFYYRGDIGALESRCISIVGSRTCTPEGQRRAARIAKELVQHDFTIVSGLAAGIDTAAMRATIDAGGRTIGVIGTPLNHAYPKENASLQEEIASDHLLISHVPFYRYAHEYWQNRRVYFPQRNETMAALSAATIIVEASETSGTHTQARACMQQKRKLFILNSCFEQGLKWPANYEKQGAVRVTKIEDVLEHLGDIPDDRTGVQLAEDGAA